MKDLDKNQCYSVPNAAVFGLGDFLSFSEHFLKKIVTKHVEKNVVKIIPLMTFHF